MEYKIAKPPSGQGKIGKAIFALARPEQEYDLLEVEINGAKRAVISVRPQARGRQGCLRRAARDRAEEVRAGAGVPADFGLEWCRQRYIELEQTRNQSQDEGQGGDRFLVRDALVWIARFSKDISWWELAIEDATGKLVRTDRSR